MSKKECLIGRQWVSSYQDSSIFAGCTKIPAISHGRCNRCGHPIEAYLPNGRAYCRECIGLGRIVQGDYLVRNPAVVKFTPPANFFTWTGQLAAGQKSISAALVQNFENKRDTLVHAVTGAGKTEMLFAAVACGLQQGARVCLATPRIDVVNELYPRFATAFAGIKIGKYHGQDYCAPGLEQLTICTTHQLMKFYRAFDLLIIDEVDSFPYVNNASLHFASSYAVKKEGCRFYLTATPPASLVKAVKAGRCQYLQLNRRFHGGLLPVPRTKFFWRPLIDKKVVNSALIAEIIKVARQKHPLLIFVPRIEQTRVLLQALKKRQALKNRKMAAVYAEDPKRLQKVAAFRTGRLDLLVTTTILERGVTFKHVWVIVVAPEDQVYSPAALVQIAGRVGRAKDEPQGLVLFCYHRYTRQIRTAVTQIKEMNR